MGRRALYLFAPPVRMKSVIFLCCSYGLLALLDFLDASLFFSNISFAFAPYGACFHTYFGIRWGFYSLAENCPTNTWRNRLISWTFSEISSKVQLSILRCTKTGFPTHRLSHRLDFFAESVKSPIFASYAGNKKTMIVITIAFVSGIPAAHMPESLNAEMSHVHHAQGSLISVVCRSSDLSIHVQTILLHKRIVSAFSRSHDSSSNDRFSPHAGCVLHGKQHFRNTATLGSLTRCLLTAEAASFRVRDSHPIPLFSEQECMSEGFSAT